MSGLASGKHTSEGSKLGKSNVAVDTPLPNAVLIHVLKCVVTYLCFHSNCVESSHGGINDSVGSFVMSDTK